MRGLDTFRLIVDLRYFTPISAELLRYKNAFMPPVLFFLPSKAQSLGGLGAAAHSK